MRKNSTPLRSPLAIHADDGVKTVDWAGVLKTSMQSTGRLSMLHFATNPKCINNGLQSRAQESVVLNPWPYDGTQREMANAPTVASKKQRRTSTDVHQKEEHNCCRKWWWIFVSGYTTTIPILSWPTAYPSTSFFAALKSLASPRICLQK